MSDFPSIPRLTSSKYFSSLLLLRNIWKGGDLSDDMQFQRVVNQRTYKGELILFAFDLCSVSDALNAVLMLRHVGFEHFLPLTDGAATCEALHALADVKALPTTPCFWSSSSNNHKGWDTWGAGAGCVSGERRRGYCKAEQLWAIRYHVAARLLASRVNLLHMDTDTVIFNDIYTRLKRKPISDYSLILLPESPVNGGLWYAQHTSLDSGAQWVIAEVARRTWEVISLRIRRRSSPPFDQAMLADALVSAMKGERHVAYMCEHPAVALQPPCANASQSRCAYRHYEWVVATLDARNATPLYRACFWRGDAIVTTDEHVIARKQRLVAVH
uniref:Nucleotide-diphospho-sugar transferase domain-containing protein n=1 Tax=Chrysotila carterae TaxID=13221 RepID=A0A7S4ETJ9_CHRCT